MWRRSHKDGYIEVIEYVNYLKANGLYEQLEKELQKSLQSAYCGQIAQKYEGD